ncbi:MAG TPA: antibiotic biosynthesis monooxygenase [Candidatus Cybelea sp.]
MMSAMTEQFPNDAKNGEPRAVVHIWSAALDPDKSQELASRVTDLLRTVANEMEGFVEGRVFQADDGKSVTVMSTWKTRHLWANALWDERVDRVLESITGSEILDVMCYQSFRVIAANS